MVVGYFTAKVWLSVIYLFVKNLNVEFLIFGSKQIRPRQECIARENHLQVNLITLLINNLVSGSDQSAHWILQNFHLQGSPEPPTREQDICRKKYTRGTNFTKLCGRHPESTTVVPPILLRVIGNSQLYNTAAKVG